MSLQVIDVEGRLSPARNLAPDVFIEFDRADDDQIMSEIRGGVIEAYVYEFKQSGQTVTGLSLVGVMAVAQHMGGITCGQPVWSSDDAEINCDISATDHKNGLTVWGTATEARTMQTRDGGRVDKFARGKALSKAQRNAIRKLIPEQIAVEMLRRFVSGERPGRGNVPRQQPAQQQRPQRQAAPPPPPVVEVVDADTGEIGPGDDEHLYLLLQEFDKRLAIADDPQSLKELKEWVKRVGIDTIEEVGVAFAEKRDELRAARQQQPALVNE